MKAPCINIVLFIVVCLVLNSVSAYDLRVESKIRSGNLVIREDFEGDCGLGLRWTLFGDTLKITGRGEMTNFASQAAVPWDSIREQIGTVEIEEGVTSIGDYAFYGCENLLRVELASTVLSIGSDAFGYCDTLSTIIFPSNLKRIGDRAFYSCSTFAKVSIPASVSSIGTAVFSRCTSLVAIDVEDGNEHFVSQDGVLFNHPRTILINYPPGKKATTYSIPDSVDKIEQCAFAGCASLTSILIPENLTTIEEYAFLSCANLASISIPERVKSISPYAFCFCKSLVSINVQNGNEFYASVDGVLFNFNKTTLFHYPAAKSDTNYFVPNSVTLIEGTSFGNAKNIQNLVIPDSVTTIEYSAFFGCGGLLNLTIGNGLTSITQAMLFGCSNLKYLTIGSNVKSIEDDAFSYCSALEKVFIPKSVRSIGNNVFKYCSNLVFIDVEDGNEFFTSVDGVLFDHSCSALIQYPIKTSNSTYSVPDGVTSIGSNAFFQSKNLKSVVFSDSVTSIGDDAFSASSVTDVNFGSRLSSIGDNAFSSCKELRSASFPKSLTSIGNSAFYACDALTVVAIPENVKTIGNQAFVNCQNLASINVDERNKHFSSVDGVLFNHNHTALLIYPMGIINTTYAIPDGVMLVDHYAFCYCDHLESVILPDSLVAIGDYSFALTNLRRIVLPQGVRSIGTSFVKCSSLASVFISDSVTVIGFAAFNSCPLLETVRIGNNVKSIGMVAFLGTALTSITIPESVESIGQKAFSSCSQLRSVFYQGEHVISSDALSSNVDLVCVSPDYNSTAFCGKNVTLSSNECQEFQRLFNHCFKAAYIDGEFTQEMRNNASEWESGSNKCVEYHCDNETGRAGWSKCNSTDDTTRICVNGQCTVKDEDESGKWVVQLDVKQTSVTEMNISQLKTTISEMTGVNDDELSVGYITDDNGYVIRVILYVKNEDIAKVISEFVKGIDKGGQCQYGVLCRAERVYVKGFEISQGYLLVMNIIIMIILTSLSIVLV